MSLFNYTCKDKSGNTQNGQIEASSESEVAEILHKKDMVIISIGSAQKKALGARTGKGGGRGVKLDDIVVLSRQLATMIEAGIPVVQALGVLRDQVENPALRSTVEVALRDVQAGVSFSDALAKHPKVFSELFVNMTRAGEASGMLYEVLNRLATYLEKMAALTRKVKSSLVYPAIVVSMSLLITAVLLLKVVPTFKNIFDILGGELPLPTQILIGISDFLRKSFLLFVGIIVLGSFILKKYINTPKGRYNFDSQKLRLPVLGTLFRKVAVAKFSRTFSTLVKSGVSVLNALDIVAKTAGNRVIEEAILNSRNSVRQGEPIAVPLSKSKVFPPMVTRMISIGEQTGKLEQMLSKVADFYDEQVDAAVSGLTSMIEPLVISFLGVVIGGIVISLFLPIFKITEMLSG